MHKKLIQEIVNNGKQEDMECLEKIMVSLIDDLKNTDKARYKNIEYKLYKMVYGEHLNEDTAKKWVSSMQNKDGTEGEHWSIEQASSYAEKFNKYDFYAVLNMMYSDYYNPRFDTSVYVQLAKDWLGDSDVGAGKTLKYYMYVVQ